MNTSLIEQRLHNVENQLTTVANYLGLSFSQQSKMVDTYDRET